MRTLPIPIPYRINLFANLRLESDLQGIFAFLSSSTRWIISKFIENNIEFVKKDQNNNSENKENQINIKAFYSSKHADFMHVLLGSFFLFYLFQMISLFTNKQWEQMIKLDEFHLSWDYALDFIHEPFTVNAWNNFSKNLYFFFRRQHQKRREKGERI